MSLKNPLDLPDALAIDAFREGRRLVYDLSVFTTDEQHKNVRGYAYPGGLFILVDGDGDGYTLPIGNMVWTGKDLAALEERLYAFAISEGYFVDPDAPKIDPVVAEHVAEHMRNQLGKLREHLNKERLDKECAAGMMAAHGVVMLLVTETDWERFFARWHSPAHYAAQAFPDPYFTKLMRDGFVAVFNGHVKQRSIRRVEDRVIIDPPTGRKH